MSLAGNVRWASFLGGLLPICVGASLRAQEAAPAGSAISAEPPQPAAAPTASAAVAPPAASAPASEVAPAPAPAAAVPAYAAPDEPAPIEEPAAIPKARFERQSADEGGEAARKHKEPEDVSSAGLFFNPVGVLLGFYGLELDLSPTRSASFNLNGVYYDKTVDSISTTAYGMDAGIQFFLSGTKPMEGAYLYPRVGYAKARATGQTTTSSSYPYYPYTSQTTRTAEASLIGVGATCGYQWNWSPFALRLGGGLIYYTNADTSSGSSSDSVSLKGTSLLIDFALGLAG
jgi:hypothetical protein